MAKISKSYSKKTVPKVKKIKTAIKKATAAVKKPIIVEKKIKVPIKISKTYIQKIVKNICVISTYFFSK